MLLSNANVVSSPAARAGFFNMENALYMTFQPHPRLTLVYSRDAFNDGVLAQDEFGMISGFPLNGYLKAGRFRNPVRTSDGRPHRGDASGIPEPGRRPELPSVRRTLPRHGRRGRWRSRQLVRQGLVHQRRIERASAPSRSRRPSAVKLGYSKPWYQGGVSFYDDFEKNATQPFRRADRWGYYGLTHWRRLEVIGEIAAGTNHYALRDARGANANLMAGFGEVDYTLNRACNFRLRFDRLELNRDDRLVTRPNGSRVSVHDLNTWNRYAVEGELLPVPFGELRWTYRVIAPATNRSATGAVLRHERQGYLQFHFSY